MIRFRQSWLILCLLVVSSPYLPLAGVHAQTVETNSLVSGNNTFALDLYARLKSGPGNLFFSPFSISACMAMTYAGARNDTAQQMVRTLHFSESQEVLHSQFGVWQSQLKAAQQKQEIELKLANGLWGQQGHPFLPGFLGIARQTYGAKLNQVDFGASPESIRREINGWVADETQGRISGLIPPGMLNRETRLVLVNAIYFKGQWARPFNRNNTAQAPFFLAHADQVPAPFMTISAGFKYAAPEGLQLLELPYRGGGFSMVVLLPGETGGLEEIERRFNEPQLNSWLALARPQKVHVFLPKFKVAGQFGLAGTLAGMGMPAAFSSAADFSGMDGRRDLHISAVVHRAFVEVNEEGTEAAAATGAAIGLTAARAGPVPIFRADHPFIFLIRDAHSGGILLLGRVDDPTK
jgi:serine protease inhibitor